MENKRQIIAVVIIVILAVFLYAVSKTTVKSKTERDIAHNNIAMSCFQEGNYEKAVEELKSSIRQGDNPQTRVNLAHVYYELKNFDKAGKELNAALALDPGYAPALYHLALIDMNKGDMSAASGLLDKALTDYGKMKYKPFFAEACNASGVVSYALGDYDKSILRCKEAIRSKPDYYEARYLLAKVYLRKELVDKAEKEYLTILKAVPGHIDARNNLANIYFSRGKVDEAADEYGQILATDPGHYKARNNLANIYLSRGEYDKAIDEYANILQADPRNAIVHFNRGLAFSAKGRYRKAVNEWETSLTIDPSFAPAQKALNDIRGVKG